VQAADLEVRAHLVDDVQREVQVGHEGESAVANQEVVLVEQRAGQCECRSVIDTLTGGAYP
jgi:hypothetical protein